MHKDKPGPATAYRDGNSLEGRYSNYFKVGHNAYEFLIDFGQFYPENETEYFHTRVITGPRHAKALLETLRDSLEQYERTFGVIRDESTDASEFEY